MLKAWLKSLNQLGVSALNLLKYGISDMFDTIEVEISTACNRRCSYCPNSKYDRNLRENMKKMDLELFKKIVAELSELNLRGRFHYHFYNEPLLDPRLISLVQYVRDSAPKISSVIVSNGEYLTLDMYKRLVKAGVKEFFVTEHTNKGSDNTKLIMEYRKSPGEESVEFTCGKMHTHSLLNRGGLLEIEKYKRRITMDCLRPSHVLQIDHEGNIILCCNDYFSTVKFGNVRDEKIIDIWKKPVLRKIRKDIRNNIFNLEICQKCMDH